jgi:hypothetical protein
VGVIALAVGLVIGGVKPYLYLIAQVCEVGDGCTVTTADQAVLSGLGLTASSYAWYLLIIGLSIFTASLIAAGVISIQRSDDWMVMVVTVYFVTTAAALFRIPNALAVGQPVFDWTSYILEQASWRALALILFVFPDGRFVPRWVKWLAYIWIAHFALEIILFPNSPLVMRTWPDGMGILLQVGFYAVGLFAQVHRYRNVSDPVQRQQTRWVVDAFVLVVVVYALVELITLGIPALQVRGIGYLLTNGIKAVVGFLFLAIPAAFIFSSMRYRLWELDFLVNRTLIYGMALLALAGAYLGTMTLLVRAQAFFRGVRVAVVG